MPTELDKIQDESVQSAARGEGPTQGNINWNVLQWYATAGETISPWWSAARDRQLREFAKQNDHWNGAMSTMVGKISAIPFHIEPRDPSIKSHWKQADDYEKRLYELSEFGQGYDSFISKTLQPYGQQDNGMFFEIIGDGKKDGPIRGPALAVASLDSSRCTRTGNPEFPVIYRDLDGTRYRLHFTRVAFRASMASNQSDMYGVGLCALSRAINTVQHLVDIATYKQEKLGSRPRRGILLTQGGLDPQHVQSAVRLADSAMDGASLARYSQVAVMGSSNLPDAALELIDLVSLPDGFDEQTSITLGMYAIALAWNVPPRWFWPATASGATKADAMFSHIAGQGAGVGSILSSYTLMLGGSPDGDAHMIGKFLPPHLKIVYDFQDDEQDRQVAEVKSTRAATRQTDLEAGVIDIRVSRQHALESGDLTEQQFAYLELEDGRLPDGGDVLSLFSSTEDIYLRLLDVGVTDPLALDANDPFLMLVEIDAAALDAQDVLVNARNAKQREQAQFAIAALSKLKDAYSEIVTQQLQAQVMAELQAEGEEPPEQESPPADEQEMIEEGQEEKGFNFGARAGEVVGGNLGRDPAGRFINADQIRGGMLAALLERLRGKREEGGLSAAEKKRLENRAKVTEKLGGSIAAGTVDGLATIREGDTPENADRLIERGFAKRNTDGTVSMTPRGRRLMNAANSGDVDRAREALEEKPKRARGGGKTAEQREQERLQEIAENRGRVEETLGDLGEDFGALASFFDGAELGAEAGARLASAGLVEFDDDGQPRLTSAGRRAVRAADRGDSRAAQDAVSVARERAQKIQDAVDEIDDQIDAIEDQFTELAAAGATVADEDRERLEEQLRQLRARRDRESQRIARKEVVPPLPFWRRLIGMLWKARPKTRAGYFDLWRDNVRELWRYFERSQPSPSGRARIIDIGGRRITRARFVREQQRNIRTYLTAAWEKGAAEFGIKPDEFTEEEKAQLADILTTQTDRGFLNGFYNDALAAWRDGRDASSFYARADLWSNRWNDVFNQAKAIVGKNRKLKWNINAVRHVEENCKTCLRLDGKVKRASQWMEAGIFPQNAPNPRLECGGWRCGCALEPTTEAMSKGPLPKTP